MQGNGKLIMFDGPDGVGKTTQFELAAEELRQQGHDIYTAHLLGSTEIGEALRSVMFSDTPRPSATNFYLALAIYYALADKIAQERSAGKIMLVDRSPLSLIAYQVYGDKYDETAGFEACTQALAAFKPDRLLLYTAPLETLQTRRQRQQQTKASDYFERQQLTYHQRTTDGYHHASKRYETTTIDASGSVNDVHQATMQAIDKLLT